MTSSDFLPIHQLRALDFGRVMRASSAMLTNPFHGHETGLKLFYFFLTQHRIIAQFLKHSRIIKAKTKVGKLQPKS